MAQKPLGEIRPGMWIQRKTGAVEKVRAVHFQGGDRVVIDTGTKEAESGSGPDRIEVAQAPPQASIVWNTEVQAWVIKADTEQMDAPPRLVIQIDGLAVHDDTGAFLPSDHEEVPA